MNCKKNLQLECARAKKEIEKTLRSQLFQNVRTPFRVIYDSLKGKIEIVTDS